MLAAAAASRRFARGLGRRYMGSAARPAPAVAGKQRRVYAWGENKHGEAGLGEDMKGLVMSPALVSGGLEGETVVSVKAAAGVSGALTESGDLYVWGANDCYQADPDKKAKFVPYRVNGQNGLNIVDFALGQKVSMMLDDQGRVYTWGWGGSFFQGAGALGHNSRDDCLEPTLVSYFEEEDVRVTAVACGSKHAIALDDEGMVYTWGQGGHGRLGHGGSSDAWEPQQMEFFFEAGACKQIAAGKNSSAAVTEDGRLFTWGSNTDMQLAIGPPLNTFACEHFPTEVTEGLQGEAVVDVEMGYTHTLITTESGRLLTAGMKIFGEPHELALGDGAKVVDAGAGKNISIACADDGNVYAWSKGRLQSKFLGHDNDSRIGSLEKQPRKIETLDGIGNVLQVASGNKHMLILVDEQ